MNFKKVAINFFVKGLIFVLAPSVLLVLAGLIFPEKIGKIFPIVFSLSLISFVYSIGLKKVALFLAPAAIALIMVAYNDNSNIGPLIIIIFYPAALIFLYIKGFQKLERRIYLKILKGSGFYSEALLASMQLKELHLRVRRHRKNNTNDWSVYSFEDLESMEKSEIAKAEARANADSNKVSNKRFVCLRCGQDMMSGSYGGRRWANKILLSGGICKKGGDCVPHEVPKGF